MHGLGDAGESWTWMRRMRLPTSAVRWHFPTAAQRPVTLNAGHRMTAWFDLDDLPVTASTPDDEPGFAASVKRIHALIDEEVAAGVAPEHIVLGGFSQGGAMTLAAGLRYGRPLGGMVVVAGWMPMRATLDDWRDSASQSTPLYFAHGDEDDKVLQSLGVAAHAMLTQRGYAARWTSFGGGHSFPPRVASEVTAFIAGVMAPRPTAAGTADAGTSGAATEST